VQQAQLEAVADVGLLTLSELEIRARQALAAPVWDYVDGGSGSETTLRRNRRALDRLAIEQRILVDVREVDLSTELLGVTLPTPIIVAPVGGLFRIHPGGDPEMARGCGRPGTPFTVSGVAGFPLEEIAQAASAPLIYQIYHHGDHEWAREWLGHVERNGFRLICLTVDTPVYSRRERDIRNRYSARTRREGSIIHPDPLYPARLTWADVRFLRSIINVPFGLKGVLHVDDAERAIQEGCDFLWVSNHGGRQLDDTRATIDALEDIAQVVRGRVPIIVDGGFRRGNDVIKAVALGATAVAIGRVPVWGLAVGGAAGVSQALAILGEEMRIGLAMAGKTSIRGLPRDMIRVVDY
jgi:isopentenyl diphosphate isomerase/L-lactate dehydrogenase-like FMN-dependent dehydrogenase